MKEGEDQCSERSKRKKKGGEKTENYLVIKKVCLERLLGCGGKHYYLAKEKKEKRGKGDMLFLTRRDAQDACHKRKRIYFQRRVGPLKGKSQKKKGSCFG